MKPAEAKAFLFYFGAGVRLGVPREDLNIFSVHTQM